MARVGKNCRKLMPPDDTGIQPPSLWLMLSGRFSQDNITLRASALSYTTLASLVPIVAIIMSVLSSSVFIDRQKAVIDKISSVLVPAVEEFEWLPGLENSAQDQFKDTFREKITQFSKVAGTVGIFGFLILITTVGMVFRTVENSFNAIWRVQVTRPFFMRVAIATSLMFWGPVMLAISISLTEYLQAWPILGSYLAPAMLTTLAFTAFFMIMPYSKVRFTSALTGGAVTALLWEIAKLIFLIYVTKVVSYSKVYGSLGLIPMLFLWVYINWIVILAGAELAYCVQYRQLAPAESSPSKEM